MNFNDLIEGLSDLTDIEFDIDPDCGVSTSFFWDDLCNGYIKPDKILFSKKQAQLVSLCAGIVEEFESQCDQEIEDFFV